MKSRNFYEILAFAASYTAVWLALDLFYHFVLFDRIDQPSSVRLWSRFFLLTLASATAQSTESVSIWKQLSGGSRDQVRHIRLKERHLN